MTNFSVIENKISLVRKYLKILDGFKSFSRQEIEEDEKIKGALERYLYLAAQAAIDLAEAVISFKKFRKPTTLRESFDILQEEKIITINLAEKMGRMAGFRNIIAHDYVDIDYDKVYDILQNRLIDIEEFLEVVNKFTK
ncbi:MAG: hypothetical protein UW11_C0026G0006 [Parcubacteria group bacterium GW2011_GWA2_43_9b]|uniref:DUF86 domain-containing protein n=1 Tax=Candidatus Portnoybacteria bacterium RIFCSPLOWO2_02_FULL_39_11 TaxID=1802001 RepID=A0A1G2FWM8_9BACT|nr:MAG: hypothetical protein UW11_C0026G0006 [Parcubacteria group bacterium GW2011_GWA2_43_9b]OGZ42020.1 MAG: hypothetical protein A3B04_03010 [Candidatus Portnoybacteria bacterium RIFCSPLOWO2_02_FULL_39_11]